MFQGQEGDIGFTKWGVLHALPILHLFEWNFDPNMDKVNIFKAFKRGPLEMLMWLIADPTLVPNIGSLRVVLLPSFNLEIPKLYS